MRTLSQQNASRTNGAKSHGPVTAEGKARVSQNGATHGIYSKRVVLAGEDPQAFDELHHSLVLAWAPVNDYEANLITDIAEARWRLARFTSLETAALDLQVDMMRPALAEEWPDVDAPTRHILAFNELLTRNRSLEVLQAAIRHQHRIIDRATSQLIKLHKMRPGLSSASANPVSDEQPAAAAAPEVTPAQLPHPAEGVEPPHPEPEAPHAENHESKPEPVPAARPRDTQTAPDPPRTSPGQPPGKAPQPERKAA